MRGEFRGDFTRDTFNPEKHYSRVLKQQGRVQLDSDWNEQVSILLHYLRTLAADMMIREEGSHGGPIHNLGFAIEPQTEDDNSVDLKIAKGHYYVDGILCENDIEGDTSYQNQPDYDPKYNHKLGKLAELPLFFVYLDVWERHISHIQDGKILEVALNGSDTATRSKLVWQVKVWKPGDDLSPDVTEFYKKLSSIETNRGHLKAWTKKEGQDVGPCKVSPESRYRGVENQLYRVEIHRGGKAWKNSDETDRGVATFKWSRENGSVAFPIFEINKTIEANTTNVTLELLKFDHRLSIVEGDLVEVVDDDYILHSQDRIDSSAEPESLFKIISVDIMNSNVTLEGIPSIGVNMEKHPLLRRWDHRHPDSGGDNCIKVVEGEEIPLEEGIKIEFLSSNAPQNVYQTGDYWLIPARTSKGDVEWPHEEYLPPHGIKHHYAPLAKIWKDGDNYYEKEGCQYQFSQVLEPVP